jgi:hypothetical protein
MSDALFRRLGFARVDELGTLLEALTLLHVHGALPGARITSASCSGGEAAHVADLAARHEIEVPMLPASVERRLCQVLGDRVAVRNPLDYHTYIWGNAMCSSTPSPLCWTPVSTCICSCLTCRESTAVTAPTGGPPWTRSSPHSSEAEREPRW